MISLSQNQNSMTNVGMPMLWLAIVVVGTAFFVAEHDLGRSLLVDRSYSADKLETAVGGGDTGRRLAFSAIAAMGLLFLVQRTEHSLSIQDPLALLVLLVMTLCIASVLWSGDPSLTVRRVAVLIFCFLGALGISKQLTARQLCAAVMVLTTAYVGVGLCTELALGTFRPWTSGYRFTGTVHPNTQGGYCSLVCLSAACMAKDAKRSRALFIALAVGGFICLLLTRSRSGFAALTVTTFVLWWRVASPRMRILSVLGTTWLLCTLLLAGGLAGLKMEGRIGNAVLLGRQEQATSLSGRIPLWTKLSEYIAQQPLLGYGYQTFWNADRIADISSREQWAIHVAHSAYVETLLGIGLIGGFVVLGAVILGVRRAATRDGRYHQPGYAFLLGLLVYSLVDGTLTSAPVQVLFFSFVVACAMVHLAFHAKSQSMQPELATL